MASNGQIRVAVVGGGIAGTTLIQALLRTNNVDVHLFEAAPEFRESGMGIGLGQNGVAALDLLGLRERLENAKAVPTSGARLYVAEGKDSGKLGVDVHMEANKSWGVQRSLFLSELLKGIDPTRLHTNKKLKNFTTTGGNGEQIITLEFEDGSTHICDVLLGADGIGSTVRKHVIGDHPSASAHFAGWQSIWVNVPYEDAQQYLGKELVNKDDPAQYGWCGNKCWLMHSVAFDAKFTAVILSKRFDEDKVEWGRTSNKAELEGWVKNFDHPAAKGIVALITKDTQEGIPMLPLRHHKPQAPNYTRDCVALVGDAADATTPWRGSGGSMSIEDALIISSCFAKVKNTADAKAALKAYETVQMPRRQRLVKESYRAGLIMSGCVEEIGLDAEKMRHTLTDSWTWIHKVNFEDQVKVALDIMKEEQAKNS